MCAIYGVVGDVSFYSRGISAMALAMSHRGPDYVDNYYGDNAIFGHNRLAITDLSSASNQPFYSACGRYILVFNGEIYNHKSLKRTHLRNVNFRSEGDTEVLIELLIKLGINALPLIDGMFAFAFYDIKLKKTLIARDRFGEKPLYYYWDENRSTFVFASEKKGLLANCSVPLEINYQSVSLALQNPFLLEEFGVTEFIDIFSLKAGHAAICEDHKYTKFQWWQNTNNSFETKLKSNNYIMDLTNSLSDSLKLRLDCDAKIGMSVSGGLDSSLLYALSSQDNDINIRYYSATFPNHPTDESHLVRKLDKHCHRNIEIVDIMQTNILSQIEKYNWYFESLYFSPPTSAGLLYERMNLDGIKVSIDGHGPDEMMGGYHLAIKRSLADISLLSKSSRKDRMDEIHQISGLDTTNLIREHIYEKIRDIKLRIKDRGATKKSAFRLYVDQMFNGSQLTRLLMNFDMMSMANSVEVRSPYLCPQFIHIVSQLNDESLYQEGFTKYPIRQVADQFLPAEIVWNKAKLGLNTPLDEHQANELTTWCRHQITKGGIFPLNKKCKNGNRTIAGGHDTFWMKASLSHFVTEMKGFRNENKF